MQPSPIVCLVHCISSEVLAIEMKFLYFLRFPMELAILSNDCYVTAAMATEWNVFSALEVPKGWIFLPSYLLPLLFRMHFCSAGE